MATSIIEKSLASNFADYAPLTSDKATALPTNADLDNYETPGMYQSGVNAEVANYTNCPTTVSFVMYVTMRSSGRPVQVVIDLQSRQFIRVKQSGTQWSAWSPSIQEVNNALSNNLQASIVKITKNASTEHAYTVPSSSRHFVIFAGTFNTAYWIGYVNGASAGAVSAYEIAKGAQTTNVNTSTNTLKFTTNSSTSVVLIDIVCAGSAMS